MRTSTNFLAIGLITLLVTTLSCPPHARADLGNTLTCIFTATLAGDCYPHFSVEEADQFIVQTSCLPPKMTGLPQFLRTPKGSAKYPFDGTCTSPDRPQAQLTYRWEGSWTPSERDPNKPNASESIHITGYEPFTDAPMPGGTLMMYWTARCAKDPWLTPFPGNCRRMGAYVPDHIRQLVPDLQAETFPGTGRVLNASDRKRLYAEYIRMNPPVAGAPMTGGTAPTAFEGSPTIIQPPNTPAPGVHVVQGQVFVKILPPRIGGGPVTELEFAWLDTPANRPRYVNAFVVDTDKLVQGYPVLQAVTQGQVGRWEVRARVSGRATPGPWSLSVPFQLVLTQPTQSQALPSRPTSAVSAVTGGGQCTAGFVSRLAGQSDNVCVTPQSHDRVLQENATAASRRNPNGPYGPNTCLAGFVWREAFAGDQVCVTPDIRTLVKDENALHASRSTGQTSPTQLMRPGTGLTLPPTSLIRPRGVEGEEATPKEESSPTDRK